MLTKIDTVDAPRAVGPYSQAVVANGLVFVSGQLPLDPKTGHLVGGDIASMTDKVIDNLEAILKEAKTSLDKVVSCHVYLKDIKKDFMQMNEVYLKRFKSPCPPARVTVEIAELPLGAKIEISCIAVI